MFFTFDRVESIHFKLDWTIKFIECAKQDSHLQLQFLIADLILASLSVTTAVSLYLNSIPQLGSLKNETNFHLYVFH